ncbi:MAG: efflux RND transporter periplasmic adaptor subunit [Planctomycetaceae bacterium]|nr:efflux RND transporter periplasmic adaptor subunit [Planctomycetaceae bacterium]
MHRALRFVALSLVLGASAAARAQDGAPQGPPPTPVRVAQVREEPLAPRRKVFGELRASRRTTLAAEENGIVRELLVRAGDTVAAGAVVARLDGSRLALEVRANAASLAAARATVAEREAAARRAARELELLGRAAAEGGTNPRELADAQSDLAVAEAQTLQAVAAVGVIEEQGAMLAKRVADLEVRAPFAGVATIRHTEIGAWVAEGGAVIDLADTATLEGWFDIPQELFEAAQALAQAGAASGERLRAIEIRTTLGARIAADAVRVVPEIEPRSRTFHAIAVVANADGKLAAGLAMNAFVPQGAPSPWTIVPKDALVYQGVNASVYMVVDGKAVPVGVRVAFPIGDEVAVEPGALPAGAQVVVEGNERLMPGATVAPIASAPASTEARQ